MVEHTLGKGEVVSSNLTGGSRSLSSAVEHLPYKQAVAGSIPAATIAREGECEEGVRLVEDAVLKTVGCKSLTGSIPVPSASAV